MHFISDTYVAVMPNFISLVNFGSEKLNVETSINKGVCAVSKYKEGDHAFILATPQKS